MGFMEKVVPSSGNSLLGRCTGQLRMKPFDHAASLRFLNGFSNGDKLKLYGGFGGTPLYREQAQSDKSFGENIKNAF